MNKSLKVLESLYRTIEHRGLNNRAVYFGLANGFFFLLTLYIELYLYNSSKDQCKYNNPS
jgi:hypothetical protein